MPRQLMKYNPAFLTEEELIRSFAVRQVDLEMLLDVIRQNIGSNSNQHILLIGPRGIGKTTLALRIAAEVRRDTHLFEHWHPIVFGEEAYEVCSPGELWLEALFHLSEEGNTHSKRWMTTYADLKSEQDETRLHDRALANLMDFADEQGKRILLIVENFQEMVGQQLTDEDGWRLRDTLMNEPRVMLLGTATTRFDQIDNQGKAMYELFRIHDLQTLSVDDCRVFWQSLTGEAIPAKRMRPIQILTGGNPRLLAMIASFAAKSSFQELMSDLTRMVDDHTDYFKSQIDFLPAQERKVFVTLADLWDPSTASDVAAGCRLDVSKTSAYLKRLAGRGAVSFVAERGGKRKYQVAERMYNIYHLMRRRGHPSSRVHAVVQFMVHYYEGDELVRRVKLLADEAIQIAPELRADYYHAYEDILKCTMDTSTRDRILNATPKDFVNCPDAPFSIHSMLSSATMPGKEQSRELDSDQPAHQTDSSSELDLLDKYLQGDTLTEKLLAFIRFFREGVGSTSDWSLDSVSTCRWLRRKIFGSNIPSENIEESLATIMNCGIKGAASSIVLAMLFHKNGQYEQAAAAFSKSLSLEPRLAWSWAELGVLLHWKLDRYDEAEQAYRKSLELDASYAGVWAELGVLLDRKLDRNDEAEQAYRKSLELDASSVLVWRQLGTLLHWKLDRYDEAEQAYRKSLELDASHAGVWAELGVLLHRKLDRNDEAEQAYRKSLELDASCAGVWAELGVLLDRKLDRSDEAEQAYRKSLELDASSVLVWRQLGTLLHWKLDRYDEAEQALRKAIELDETYACAWAELGMLLRWKLDRYDEAEQTLRKALELKPSLACAQGELTALLLTDSARLDEALDLAEQCLENAGRSAESLNSMAWAVFDSDVDDLSLAEAWANEAVQKSPRDLKCLHTLASIQGRGGRWLEALQTAKRFLVDADAVGAVTSDVVDLFVTAAANAYADESLAAIRNSPSSGVLEPLVVGLRMYLGEEVSVAKEIEEVAEDIVKRIREQEKGSQAR